MKKILFLLASIFCLNSFSQITVIDTSKSIKIGEVTQVGVPIIDCFKEDNKYTFKYYNNINKANNEYKKFSIINLDNDFEKLDDIFEWLKNDETSVAFIIGPGGDGKTTVCQKIHDVIISDFDNNIVIFS